MIFFAYFFDIKTGTDDIVPVDFFIDFIRVIIHKADQRVVKIFIAAVFGVGNFECQNLTGIARTDYEGFFNDILLPGID